MTEAVLQFLMTASLIIVAGIFLTQYADAIAELTGFGRLLVGSILLAGATSLPELMVDMSAVRLGNSDLATGDLLGSSLFNLLILAVLDLWRKSSGRLFSRQVVATCPLSDIQHCADCAGSGLNTMGAEAGGRDDRFNQCWHHGNRHSLCFLYPADFFRPTHLGKTTGVPDRSSSDDECTDVARPCRNRLFSCRDGDCRGGTVSRLCR